VYHIPNYAKLRRAAYRGVLDASTSPPKERSVGGQLTEILWQGARSLPARRWIEVTDLLGNLWDRTPLDRR
jgi:hypothetical protein